MAKIGITENKTDNDHRLTTNPALRVLLLGLGSTAVVLGSVGIFLPVLPTTPFLLLAAACYVRSSTRFYHWLTSHPLLSRYLLSYLDGKGIPRRAKYYTLSLLWLTMGLSIWVTTLWQLGVMLVLIGIGVSIYILRLPSLEPS